MKKLILTFGLALFISFAFATAPPMAVQKAFRNKFPQAKQVSWAKEKQTEWAADFVLSGAKVSASFAEDGTWLASDKGNTTELPASVSKPKKNKPNGWIIIEPYGSVTV